MRPSAASRPGAVSRVRNTVGRMSDELRDLWAVRWPECPPIADELKSVYRDRWVRFHSLPESKRYPESADEWAIVLDRYNTILDELFTGTEVYVITPEWSGESQPGPRPDDHVRWHPEARHWQTIRTDSDDPEYVTYTHLYVSRNPWKRGDLDDLLRAVADDVTYGVLIADVALERIHHPYDGGADVILTTSEERDLLRTKYSQWLSNHPLGY